MELTRSTRGKASQSGGGRRGGRNDASDLIRTLTALLGASASPAATVRGGGVRGRGGRGRGGHVSVVARSQLGPVASASGSGFSGGVPSQGGRHVAFRLEGHLKAKDDFIDFQPTKAEYDALAAKYGNIDLEGYVVHFTRKNTNNISGRLLFCTVEKKHCTAGRYSLLNANANSVRIDINKLPDSREFKLPNANEKWKGIGSDADEDRPAITMVSDVWSSGGRPDTDKMVQVVVDLVFLCY